MLQHVDWQNDAMLITFAKHKGDQTGEGLGNEKHVYANPLNPTICPLLALAVLVFTKHRAPNAKQQLFEGTKSEDRFVKILQTVLQLVPENILGACRKDIGTHSNRKGCATFLHEFCNKTPVQVYLRAGWSLGNVPDRYIFAGAGGDQVVGRAASGLPINAKEFATLPPHFTRETMQELNDIGWEHVLEGYKNYPASFQRVIPFLFASLIFHMDFLRETLHAGHPLWSQKMFTCRLPSMSETAAQKFAGVAITGINVCKNTNMFATGIPQGLSLALEIEKLQEAFREMSEQSAKDRELVVAAVNGIPEQVKNLIMATFQVEGAVPPAAQQEPFMTFFWGGRFRAVPYAGWRFPSLDAKTMWSLWHHGHAGERIRPYKQLRLRNWIEDVEESSRDNISRTARVLQIIEDEAIARGLLIANQDVSTLSLDASIAIFDACYPAVNVLAYRDSARAAAVRSPKASIATLANRLYRKRPADANAVISEPE
jgi:hypothetical protein